jgi:DNA-binding transcriptional ArsR family regulator
MTIDAINIDVCQYGCRYARFPGPALELSPPTVSHHLRVPFEAGLVERERRGNWVYYRAVPQAFADLREAFAEPDPTP